VLLDPRRLDRAIPCILGVIVCKAINDSEKISFYSFKNHVFISSLMKGELIYEIFLNICLFSKTKKNVLRAENIV